MIDEIINRILTLRTYSFDNPNMQMIFSLSELEQIVKWHDEAGKWGKIKELSGDLEEPESIHEMHEAEVEKNHDRKIRYNVAKQVIYEIRRRDNPTEGETKTYDLFAWGGIGILEWIFSGDITIIGSKTARTMIKEEMEKD